MGFVTLYPTRWLAVLSGGLIFLLLCEGGQRKLPGLMARLRQQGGLLYQRSHRPSLLQIVIEDAVQARPAKLR